jgi:protein-S-isoprenylcysteine O-methyltransferase Ste14
MEVFAMPVKRKTKGSPKAVWGAALFYLLIAFEIFYMAGPFAVYFYGVYNPILNFFNQLGPLSILNSFFLPHVARETTSAFINAHAHIGSVLAGLGFAAFCVGACQIYYSKFTRKGAVTGGIYNMIRHPQYTSFAVCGFGLLIVWPRVINLVMYATMLFIYYLLAKAEEKECEEKFGQTYIDYKSKTTMFFPFKIPLVKKLPALPASKGKRAVVLTCMYITALVIAIAAAKGITLYSVNSLYAYYTENSATVSLSETSADKLELIMSIAASDERLNRLMDDLGNAKLLNYVLPAEWYAAEVPMNGVRDREGHRSPSDYDDARYKVIFTAAEIRGDSGASGKDILTSVIARTPLLEVWVDLNEQKVIQTLDIPEDYKYKGIPVAVY